MDKELEKYYESRFEMMSSKGWNDLMEDAKIMRDNYANIVSINTSEELHFRKGQLDMLDWLLTLREVSSRAFEDLQD